MDKLLAKLFASVLERSCKNYITTIIGILAFLSCGGLALAQYATVQHLTCATSIQVLAGFLGMVAGALGYDKQIGAKVSIALFALFALFPSTVVAQSPEKQFYAAGASYSVNATPGVAGTALYARSLTDVGTYAFTIIDAVPGTTKPFTVTTNIGAGIAQKVFSIGKVPVFMPTSAGIGWNGSNTGFQWSGGGMAVITMKKGYYIMPSVRFMKSNANNGAGYQPIVGILFGWGN